MRALQTREVVHDMRQPIATIAALVGAAEAQEGLSPEVCRSLRQIKEQARELSELCRRMLEDRAEPGVVAVDELVVAAVRRAEVAYGCAIELATTRVRIFGDDVNLRRALGNLLENACRAAADAGPVRVSVREVGAEVVVEVSDSGPGFGAGPPGTASLGLAIVEGIVRQHGGRVEISASDLGGATVTMVVPALGHSHPAQGSSPLMATAASFVVDMRETEQRCPA